MKSPDSMVLDFDENLQHNMLLYSLGSMLSTVKQNQRLILESYTFQFGMLFPVKWTAINTKIPSHRFQALVEPIRLPFSSMVLTNACFS